MRPDVHLAGATQILGGHREAVERVRAVHEDVMREDVAVLERERVEAAPEFGHRQQQRHVEAASLPGPGQLGAGGEIRVLELRHECEGLHRRLDGARVRSRMRAEHGHRLQPGTEDAGKIVGQGAGRLEGCHGGILSNA